jgi:hypothetical protein
MTLLARPNMMGSAPRVLAEECRSILQEEVFPALHVHLPWLEGSFRIGDD